MNDPDPTDHKDSMTDQERQPLCDHRMRSALPHTTSSAPTGIRYEVVPETIHPPVGQAKPATLPCAGRVSMLTVALQGTLGQYAGSRSVFARVLIVLGPDGSRPLPRRI